MFALRKLWGSGEGGVLPRPLRRPARLFWRLLDGDLQPPRFAAALASACVIGGAVLYGAFAGGHMPDLIASSSARIGFAVEEVRISGHTETSEIDILERLQLDGWTSLVRLDAEAARERITGLPWVETASVRKVYPGAIEIGIVEREPFAIWQRGRDLSLIEKDGSVIARFSGGRHASLPLVLGAGAPREAADFIARVERHPALAGRVRGYIRVGERRWDLRLENGITVKLPERNVDGALAALMRLDRDKAVLARDITSIDMRFEDRLIVGLEPETAQKLNAVLEKRLKAAQQGRRI